MNEKDLSLTQKMDTSMLARKSIIDEILTQAKDAMLDKGYDPISQIVGYILSGDPTYITSHKGARNKVSKIERNELLEEIIKNYLESLKSGE